MDFDLIALEMCKDYVAAVADKERASKRLELLRFVLVELDYGLMTIDEAIHYLNKHCPDWRLKDE